MNIRKHVLFKAMDGAAVGTVGATIVNLCAMAMKSDSADVKKIALIMAVGSVIYGLARQEHTNSDKPLHSIKHNNARCYIAGSNRLSSMRLFAQLTRNNIIGNAISAGLGLTAFTAISLMCRNGDSINLSLVRNLLLSVTAGSAVEAIYQPMMIPR